MFRLPQILGKAVRWSLVGVVALALSPIAFAAPASKPPGENPYKVERSWPPYTRPMYGTPWIITPEIYTGWVSWFDGDATNLLPTDSGDSYTVELRNSILEITPVTAPAGMSAVSLTADQLRAVLAGEEAKVGGDRTVLKQLIAYLDREQQGFSMHVR